jgi:exopolysaccharide biosynthesis protein
VDRLPARLDREVAWRAGAAGIEYGELQLTGSGEAWRTRVVVARLDPRRVVLSLEAAFTEDALWTVGDAESAAVFAVNAGQFRGALPWGWVVTGGRQLISPGQGPLAGAVVVDRSGAVRIVPPDDVVAEQRRGEAREAFQSYPMLLENGAPPVALLRPGLGVAVDHRDTRLALGTLPDGRVVIALTRFDALGPRLGKLPFGFTSAEMARVMRALGCRDAILLDGGISGQLMVRRDGGAVQTWAGIRSVPLGLVALPR